MRSPLFSSNSPRLSPPLTSSSSSPFVHRQGRPAVLVPLTSKAIPTPVHSGSIMEKVPSGPLLRIDTECSSLLDELHNIWNDVGESDVEKDVMLLELEKECLEIYRRKVDQANKHRAQLRQVIADSEAEIATICSAMGERTVHFRQSDRSLKEEFKATIPQLEEMREKKNERMSQFFDVVEQIRRVSSEIRPEHSLSEIVVDESDLSTRKLEDLHRRLNMLQKEKNDRLRKVLDHLNTLNSLCLVLDIDFKQTAGEVHPSLDGPDESKNISSDTIERLTHTIQRLREVKLQRMHMLQDLATAMLEMWHLMDTPVEEQQQFHNVTCNIAASEHEITETNSLSMRFINHVEAEVRRLEKLKASKMMDLVLKKKIELDELRRQARLVAEIETIETESVNPSLVLEQMEIQISIVKEEAFSRKEILERVEKWLAACEEETWLEEYNRDENRYNAGKGTHLMLKRAEKARVVVSKIPAIVETLITKIMIWENERGSEFIYDGCGVLSMLEDYSILKQEKEHEKKRQRDERRLQGQLIAEQEVMFGSSKPASSPLRSLSSKKLSGTKRQSVGGVAALQSLPSFKSPSSAKKQDTPLQGREGGGENEIVMTRRPFTPLSQSRSFSSIPHTTSTGEAEEENKTPMGSPLSAPKSPSKQMTTNTAAADFAQEISFEERRLALLLKGWDI